jgi:uncharacterized protein
MGHPVVHFEVVGTDGDALKSYYSRLFEWEIDDANPMGYGIVSADGNRNAQGQGIGGGVSGAPPGYAGHVTFYVEVPDVEATMAEAERLGGSRVMGPDEIPGMNLVIGHIADPEGHMIGVMRYTGTD